MTEQLSLTGEKLLNGCYLVKGEALKDSVIEVMKRTKVDTYVATKASSLVADLIVIPNSSSVYSLP